MMYRSCLVSGLPSEPTHKTLCSCQVTVSVPGDMDVDVDIVLDSDEDDSVVVATTQDSTAVFNADFAGALLGVQPYTCIKTLIRGGKGWDCHRVLVLRIQLTSWGSQDAIKCT